ncbi:MAG TPA: hypothetical protein VK919_10030 [Solirubrobacterales bacterium]|nr:hypothetical protein [Solirubrobacterales bacterium]
MDALTRSNTGTRSNAGTRLTKSCGIVAAVAGLTVLVAIIGLNLGTLPSVPAKFVLGVSIPMLYGTWLAALPRGEHPEWMGVPIAVMQPRSRVGRLRASRHRCLVALGVPEEVALVLAGHPAFSLDELKRLLGKGCPVDTALRILWPD